METAGVAILLFSAASVLLGIIERRSARGRS